MEHPIWMRAELGLRGQGASLKGLLGLARMAALGGLLALAGCVTANNSLSQSDIDSMKLAGVAVSFAPDARIQWEDGLRAYADSKAVSLERAATMADTPEARAFVQGLLTPRIKAGVEQVLALGWWARGRSGSIFG
jgi:hypothetical protein